MVMSKMIDSYYLVICSKYKVATDIRKMNKQCPLKTEITKGVLIPFCLSDTHCAEKIDSSY